jgi:prolyl-tRNA synthetase
MRTRLFLRTTEFLWQEGHTAHATAEEAQAETLQMLDVYRRFAEDYMAIPVHVGIKTEREKFAGAVRTYCIEAMMQDRRALQAGTSHNLGQNFAKAFDVKFQDEEGELTYVYATSWGVSTRLIGALIMTHSDDRGLVLPPRMAPNKAVMVPIWRTEEEMTALKTRISTLTESWQGHLDYFVDDRDQYRPGYKFNEWEKKGVPIRIEIGPRDLENNVAVLVRRDTGEKITVSQDGLLNTIQETLETMQQDLYQRAKDLRERYTFKEDDFDRFKTQIEDPGGFFWVHWCGSEACETAFQDESKATIRLMPMEDGPREEGRCIVCGNPSSQRVLVSKAY